jgi:hypothetical protein
MERVNLKPRYKEHRGVDNRFGVITGSLVTSGIVDDGSIFKSLVYMHEDTTELKVKTGIGDSKYGIIDNYLICKDKGIEPHFEDLKSTQEQGEKRRGLFSSERFIYNEETDTFICPDGKRLERRSRDKKRHRIKYISSKEDCENCTLQDQCTKSQSGQRTVDRHERQEDIDKMRAEALSSGAREDLRKRWPLMERTFADGKNQHGLKRARWRRLWREQIQGWMIAAVQDIRILINHAYLDVKSGEMAIEKPRRGNLKKIKFYFLFILSNL